MIDPLRFPVRPSIARNVVVIDFQVPLMALVETRGWPTTGNGLVLVTLRTA